MEQPQQRRREKKNKRVPPPSYSLLPDEILLNCLAYTSRSDRRSLSGVSKSIRSLISSPEFYPARCLKGRPEPCLYLCEELRHYDRWYTLDQTLITNAPCIKDESSLSLITSSAPSAPSKPTALAVGFEIYLMGGTIDNDNRRPSSVVRVLDCRTHTWRNAPDMTVPRKRGKAAFIDGKIFVTGGIRRRDSYYWCEFFDLRTQTWNLFPSPMYGAKVKLRGGKLYVTNFPYDFEQGKWKETTALDPEHTFGPWCVIQNVKFTLVSHKFKWYDSERLKWFMVEGLEHLYTNHPSFYLTIRLAQFCGKLVILWDEPSSLELPQVGKPLNYICDIKRIWCAVIALEKRIGFSGLKIWGHIERLNAVLTVPSTFNNLCCVTV